MRDLERDRQLLCRLRLADVEADDGSGGGDRGDGDNEDSLAEVAMSVCHAGHDRPAVAARLRPGSIETGEGRGEALEDRGAVEDVGVVGPEAEHARRLRG